MTNLLLSMVIASIAWASGCRMTSSFGQGAGGAGLAHIVYFTLKDSSEAAKSQLVEGCRQYLTDHRGVTFLAVGTRVKEFDRDVNDHDFHVGLHVVFQSQHYHDLYQTAPSHLEFIEKFKENWQQVRVFDTFVR